MCFSHQPVAQAFGCEGCTVGFAVVAFVGINFDAFAQVLEVVGFVGIGRGGVYFFDIAFGVGAGVLFVAETVFAIFFDPTGIGVFAGGWFGL